MVAAAGNNGPAGNSVTIPGICRTIITVGSSDDDNRQAQGQGLRRGYSGRGPTDSCVIKPEILAPGTKLQAVMCIMTVIRQKAEHRWQHGGFRCDCTTVKQISADVPKGCKTSSVPDCQQKLRQKRTACVGLPGFSTAHALDIRSVL